MTYRKNRANDRLQFRPVAFARPGGVTVEAYLSHPPKLVGDLPGSFDELRDVMSESTAERMGALLRCDLMTVAGRQAVRRIERLPGNSGYAGILIIVLSDVLTLEVSIVVRASAGPGGRPTSKMIRQLTATAARNLRLPPEWANDMAADA